jgi:hypothetical protein
VRIFTLDPSLTAVGWCSADIHGKEIDVVHVGRVIPPKKGGILERTHILTDGVRSVFYDRALNGADNGKVEVVIEIPSGRATHRHAGGGYGLATYGFAVGALFAAFEILWGDQVHGVNENWTGSRTKDARREIALRHYSALNRLKDPGYDISDAVSLAVWWAQIGRKKRKGADA